MKRKLLERNEEEVSRKTLTVIPSLDGTPYHQDLKGNFWRTFLFIEKAQTFQAVQSYEQAFEAGKSFGHFQAVLDDLPSPRLIETIPDFHNTAKRFRALEKAVNRDACNRAKSCRREIDFVLNRTAESTILIQAHHDGRIPERITHNDTKFNNLMLDEETGLGICILDLDTVMPGLSLYDFGDMVRTTTSPAEEDEQDLSKVIMQMPMFEALVKGFLESIRDMLTPTEIEYLAFSGRLITIELGARFLTDFLEGDVYFRTHRECHNLDRARVQFKLVESMESQLDEMEQVVKAAVS
jgi:Ser/Thr protein kinase RdoA (MazF antagonist)